MQLNQLLQDLAILHCVSGYPAPAQDYNLKTMLDMIDRFGMVLVCRIIH